MNSTRAVEISIQAESAGFISVSYRELARVTVDRTDERARAGIVAVPVISHPSWRSGAFPGITRPRRSTVRVLRTSACSVSFASAAVSGRQPFRRRDHVAHLLHIDASVRVEGSVSRALARAAHVWPAVHPRARCDRADA